MKGYCEKGYPLIVHTDFSTLHNFFPKLQQNVASISEINLKSSSVKQLEEKCQTSLPQLQNTFTLLQGKTAACPLKSFPISGEENWRA